MKFSSLIVTVILSAAVAYATVEIANHANNASSATAAHESAYDRIMRTKTIRCAYADLPPVISVDNNTKAITGIYHDIIEDIAQRLSLKIDWVEEVGYDNINAGFASGRYDIFCGPIWPTSNRASGAIFSAPVYFSSVFVWVRGNDTRIDGDPKKLNDAHYTVSLTYGDVSQVIIEKDFPLAKHLAASGMADVSQKMQDVVSGKSDATVTDPVTIAAFNKNNPGALKNPASDKPIRVFPNTILMPHGEHDLKAMIDTVLGEMQADGTIEDIVKKYTGDNSPYYFSAKNYEIK